MNEFAKGDIEFWNNKVFLGVMELDNVQSLSYTVDPGLNNFNYLGSTTSPMLISSPSVGTLNITKQLNGKDLLFNLTGSQATNFSLLIDKNDLTQYVGFVSGYLTNYSLDCKPNKIPEISAQIQTYYANGNLNVYDNPILLDEITKIRLIPDNYTLIGYGDLASGSNLHFFRSGTFGNVNTSYNSGDLTFIKEYPQIGGVDRIFTGGEVRQILSNTQFRSTIANAYPTITGMFLRQKKFIQSSSNTLVLSIDESNYNRIQSINLSIDVERIPIYYLGNNYPSRVITNYPNKITCQFEIEVDTFQMQNYSLFPTGTLKEQNITISMKDYVSGKQSYMTYSLGNMFLTSESYSTEVGGVTRANLVYNNYKF